MLIKKIIILIFCLLVLGAEWKFVQIFVADTNYESSNNFLNLGDLPKAWFAVDNAIRFNPLEPNYYRGRAKLNLVSLVEADEDYKKDTKDDVLSDLQKAYNLNKNNLVTIRNLVPLYYFLAVKDIQNPGAGENIDPKYISYTKDFFEKAKETYENDAGVYALIAKYEKRLGLEKEYQETTDRIKYLRPDILQWHESFN